ncbi:AraC family transcriptional regulator [Candidatus Parcubacteria bacterium]|nr:MAG: AraC family transcriptional regulator [Candidatus Parcubacteria bacterium]
MDLEQSKSERIPLVTEVEQKIRPPIKVVSLSGKGDPRPQLGKEMAKIYSWLEKKGIVSVGPTFATFHTRRDEVGVENVEWDACVPISVNSEVETKDEFRCQELPGAKVISTTLTGSYDLIGEALNCMENQAKTRGIKTKWPLTEIYWKVGENPVTELQYLVDEEETS